MNVCEGASDVMALNGVDETGYGRLADRERILLPKRNSVAESSVNREIRSWGKINGKSTP
jgi:hypothetical protein